MGRVWKLIQRMFGLFASSRFVYFRLAWHSRQNSLDERSARRRGQIFIQSFSYDRRGTGFWYRYPLVWLPCSSWHLSDWYPLVSRPDYQLPWIIVAMIFLRVCSQMPGNTNKSTAAISFQIFFHYSLSSFANFSFNSGYTSSKFVWWNKNLNYVFLL
jgi:hypothetical protein